MDQPSAKSCLNWSITTDGKDEFSSYPQFSMAFSKQFHNNLSQFSRMTEMVAFWKNEEEEIEYPFVWQEKPHGVITVNFYISSRVFCNRGTRWLLVAKLFVSAPPSIFSSLALPHITE